MTACLALSLSGGFAVGESAGVTGVACADCHEFEARQFSRSVHSAAGFDCRSCHGGADSYPVVPAILQQLRRSAGELHLTTHPATAPAFDHGVDFRGRPTHRDIPERCASCHNDVSMMNPYGLPTDQYAQYRLSGHGRALYEQHNDRAAVCIDCHGTHEILRPKDPADSVYPKNVPATCGRCHSDPSVMAGSHLSTRVVEEYRQSVHGQGLLEQGDLGMPHCATCHGSHSAVPPGFRDVGHVCGRCHQQEEQRYLESPHAKFPLFPRCVACHTHDVDLRDHRIMQVTASPQAIKKAYTAVVQAVPGADIDDPRFQEAFAARRVPPVPSYETFCKRCHSPARETAHRMFFVELDRKAAKNGEALYDSVLRGEIHYAATAARVEQAAQGVLLVTDEALMLEEARTKLVSLAPLQHTLDVHKVHAAAGELDTLTDEIDRSIGRKVRDLQWRRCGLVPMWAFLAVFVGVLWVKYKRLKAAMVVPLPGD